MSGKCLRNVGHFCVCVTEALEITTPHLQEVESKVGARRLESFVCFLFQRWEWGVKIEPGLRFSAVAEAAVLELCARVKVCSVANLLSIW